MAEAQGGAGGGARGRVLKRRRGVLGVRAVVAEPQVRSFGRSSCLFIAAKRWERVWANGVGLRDHWRWRDVATTRTAA